MDKRFNQVGAWMLSGDYGPMEVAAKRYEDAPRAEPPRTWGLVCGLAYATVQLQNPHAGPVAIGRAAQGLAERLWEIVGPVPSSAEKDGCPLSERELEVLRHVAEGLVCKQIAGEMQLSVSTIRTHLHNVYGKIGVVNGTQAVLFAFREGWLGDSEEREDGEPPLMRLSKLAGTARGLRRYIDKLAVERDELVHTALAEGHTQERVAAAAGVSQSLVSEVARERFKRMQRIPLDEQTKAVSA